MNGGRPLRFLILTLGGWVAMRTLALLPPTAPLPAAIAAPAVAARLAVSAPVTRVPVRRHVPIARMRPRVAPARAQPSQHAHPGTKSRPAMLAASAASEAAPALPQASLPPPLVPTPIATGRSRFAGSAWLLARGGPAGSLDGGQLGASQAGIRFTYALGSARRVALAARLSAPLRGRGREAALGVEWRPTRLPVRLIAEQRIALDGGRGGPTIGVIGGYGPAEIARGVRLEAYGQAGMIARDGVEAFIDTAARVSRPVAIAGGRLDLGVGAWGSAQRGARRLDIGPTLGVAVPIAGKSLRLNLDWRQRIGGAARPGSGLAVSIGSDF